MPYGPGYQGLPGDRLTGGQGYRLASLLARQNVNNGTVAGGLANILQQAMLGMAMKEDRDLAREDRDLALKDRADATDANQAMARGLSAKPWVNPDTGSVAPNQTGVGGMEGAMYALGNLPDNAHAGRLASSLMATKFEKDAALESQKALKLAPSYEGPTSTMREYEYAKQNGFTGSFADFKKIGTTAPSNVQEWQFYSELPKDKQEAYLAMKRANPYINLGGSMVQPSQTQPGAALGGFDKTIPPEDRPETKRDQALATGRGKTQAENEANAPGAVVKADEMLASVDRVLNDPNLEISTGMLSKLSFIPGTPQYDFTTKLKQLQGQAFLQAFESLKGGGQITQVEGEKATQAIARLDAAQSTPAFKAAMDDLRGILVAARARAQAKLPQGAPAGQPPAQSGGWSIQRVE